MDDEIKLADESKTDKQLLLEIKKSVYRTEDKIAELQRQYIELLAKIGKDVKPK